MNITKTFTVEPSQTSAEIAEAFGIEGGHKLNVVDVEIPTPLPDVTYITGESGCGKTTLLHEIGGDDTDATVPDGPLWTWGDSKEESLEYLSKVGLGDATLFVSEYDELSDSQQYRAQLYLNVMRADSGDTLYFDEFLSTLDRTTAHSVAYLFQKVIREENLSVVCATAHNDLEMYLQPNITITGRAFPHRWDVTEHQRDSIKNPFVSEITFEWKDKEWYRGCRLAELHYKGKYTGGVKDYLAGYIDGKLVSVLVAVYRIHDGGRRIARLVTHPSYRGIGVGQATVQRYLEKEPAADVVAAMAKYNPVFQRAGMKRVENSVVSPPTGLKTDLDNYNFNRDRWYEKSYCRSFMNKEENRKMFSQYASDVSHLVTPGGEQLSDEEVAEKIRSDAKTAGRVLWNVRPKEMAKFVGPEYDS